MPIYSDDEMACIKRLVEWVESGRINITRHGGHFAGLQEAVGVDHSRMIVILQMLSEHNIITDVKSTKMPFETFSVTSKAVQIMREIEIVRKREEEGKDIVDQVKNALRRHPIGGWLFVSFLALLALITFANQLISLIKNFW